MTVLHTAKDWSLRRTWLIGKASFLEAVRMRLFYALLALSLFSLASSFLLQEFNFGSDELKFIMDFGFGGMTFFGSILAIVVASQLFYGEIEHRTAFTVLAKPIFRSEFLLGKFLGVWLSVFSFVVCLALCLVLALFVRETILINQYPDVFANGRHVNYSDVIGFAAMQCVRLGILASLVVLFSSYATSALFSIVLGVVIWVVGQLQYLAANTWGTHEGWLIDTVLFVVSIALPNFHLFDFGDRVAGGVALSIMHYMELLVYGCLYTSLYLSLAIVAFNAREL